MSTRQSWNTRAENPAEHAIVHAITLAAFDTPLEAGIVEALRTDPGWIDGLSLVAVDTTDTPIAHALLTRNHIGDTEALCLGPVSVLPRYQRSGAGSAVVRAALETAVAHGERFVTVLGHPEYYPRFGFTRASLHGIRMSVEVPDEALMAMALRPGDTLPSGVIRYAGPLEG
ncbi:GNAT family N-acetyltransferase [Nocardia sp. NPDC127526]|uniref:GNAT family N-acetyltransferase n=1 Tax=Nocardia sp. NPDC127526 TaxID=3345393 RepID=UPI00363691FD